MDYEWGFTIQTAADGTADVDPLKYSLLEAVCHDNVETLAGLLEDPGAAEAAKQFWVMRLEAKDGTAATAAAAGKKKRKQKPKQQEQRSNIGYPTWWPTSLVGCCPRFSHQLLPLPSLHLLQIHVAMSLSNSRGEMLSLLYRSGVEYGEVGVWRWIEASLVPHLPASSGDELMMGAISAGATALVAELFFDHDMDVDKDM